MARRMSDARDVRVAFVTGASKGIGAAVAGELAATGTIVAVGYGGDETGARATVAAVEAAGGRAHAVQCDVADAKSVDTRVATSSRPAVRSRCCETTPASPPTASSSA